MLNAIFSDIHSNLQAYEAFIEDCKKEKIDKYYCVGDIVGYGANPKECINLTQKLNCPVVCGNHDWAVCGKVPCDYFNQNAKEAVFWTQSHTDEADKNYLSNLPLVYEEGDFILVHGSLDSPEEFNYIFETSDAEINFELQKSKVCFIGHTHAPAVFFKGKRHYAGYITEPQIQLQDDISYLVNVGSIGQPRDNYWKACYCIYDDERAVLSFKRIEYDVETASKAIINAGLPLHLAYRIKEGR